MSSVRDIIRRSPRLRPRNPQEIQFIHHLSTYWDGFRLCKEDAVLRKALSVVPIEEMEAKCVEKLAQLASDSGEGSTSSQSSSSEKFDKNDIFFQLLLEWFKKDFFKWFDCGFCENCQQKMTFRSRQQPNQEELVWLASTVEVYQCSKCETFERFPRYNHPLKLLETRKGRCGEWRNCFTAICYAFDYEMRLVDDWNDHVWNEVYCQSQKRWIHCDCCENAFDTPLMYETGWGKKETYCIALSETEVQDVTWRYTREPEKVIARREFLCRPSWLNSVLLKLTNSLQEKLSPEKRKFLIDRRIAEMVDFVWLPGFSKGVKEDELKGRVSGAVNWKLSRNEMPEVGSKSGNSLQ